MLAKSPLLLGSINIRYIASKSWTVTLAAWSFTFFSPSQPPLPKLRAELDSFDPSFFEEVEDLKFNYQEEVKKNIQYEQQITCLLGVSPSFVIILSY